MLWMPRSGPRTSTLKCDHRNRFACIQRSKLLGSQIEGMPAGTASVGDRNRNAISRLARHLNLNGNVAIIRHAVFGNAYVHLFHTGKPWCWTEILR